MMGLLSASSPNACGFGTSRVLPQAVPDRRSAIAPAYAEARPTVLIVRCMLMIGLVGMGGRGLEARSDLHAEDSRGRLHQEPAVERERARAGPVHVRIDAVAVVPPPNVLTGHRD